MSTASTYMTHYVYLHCLASSVMTIPFVEVSDHQETPTRSLGVTLDSAALLRVNKGRSTRVFQIHTGKGHLHRILQKRFKRNR